MRRIAALSVVLLALSGCLRVTYDRCSELPPHPDCADGGTDAGARDDASTIDAATIDAFVIDAATIDAFVIDAAELDSGSEPADSGIAATVPEDASSDVDAS